MAISEKTSKMCSIKSKDFLDSRIVDLLRKRPSKLAAIHSSIGLYIPTNWKSHTFEIAARNNERHGHSDLRKSRTLEQQMKIGAKRFISLRLETLRRKGKVKNIDKYWTLIDD